MLTSNLIKHTTYTFGVVNQWKALLYIPVSSFLSQSAKWQKELLEDPMFESQIEMTSGLV